MAFCFFVCPVQSQSYAFAFQFPFDSSLHCMVLTKEKAEYEGRGTLKSLNLSCTVFLSPRLALHISDYDPVVPQMKSGCFCCGNRRGKRWDGGLSWWAVFVRCCFFFLSYFFPLCFFLLWVVHFPSWILKTQKSPHSPLSPLSLFFLFLPIHSSLASLLRK